MGVEWEVCKKCKKVFPDAGHYVPCDCGLNWCSDECAEQDGYEVINGEDFYEMSCNFCRKEDFSDSVLLNYALEILNYNREELISELVEDKKLKG